MAPRTVPTMAQQIPTKAIMTMNQRMLTDWDTIIPQQVLESSSSRGGSPPHRRLKYKKKYILNPQMKIFRIIPQKIR